MNFENNKRIIFTSENPFKEVSTGIFWHIFPRSQAHLQVERTTDMNNLLRNHRSVTKTFWT